MFQIRNKIILNYILVFSVFAILAAYFIQYILGHEPCNLCLIERIPYVLALIILIINFKNKYFIKYWLFFIIYILFTCSIFFLTNDEKWYFHTAVGLDRIMFQTSGIFLFPIIKHFKEYMEK